MGALLVPSGEPMAAVAVRHCTRDGTAKGEQAVVHVRRHVRTWQEAEENAAAWMRHAGFADARLTQAGADGGIDVKSREAVAQVKFEARQVSRPQLQAFIGASMHLGVRHRLYFTGTGYSTAALDYANTMDIALFTYVLDGRVTAANQAAKKLERQSHRRDSARRPNEAEIPPVGLSIIWLALALLFTWLFISGLLNPVNHRLEFGIIVVGLSLGGLASLFWRLLVQDARAALTGRRYRGGTFRA